MMIDRLSPDWQYRLYRVRNWVRHFSPAIVICFVPLCVAITMLSVVHATEMTYMTTCAIVAGFCVIMAYPLIEIGIKEMEQESLFTTSHVEEMTTYLAEFAARLERNTDALRAITTTTVLHERDRFNGYHEEVSHE